MFLIGILMSLQRFKIMCARILNSLRLRYVTVCFYFDNDSNYALFCSFGIAFSKITQSLHFLGSLSIVFGMRFLASSGRRTQMNSNQQKFSLTSHQRLGMAPVQGVFIPLNRFHCMMNLDFQPSPFLYPKSFANGIQKSVRLLWIQLVCH